MSTTPLDRVPAWSLAVVAMLSVQLGAAISVGLFDEVGVGGTAWLRLTLGAIGFVLIARPRYWQWSLRELRAPVLLGVVSGLMTLAFLAAIDRLPLGTVVAIEFLGPLTVAALHSRDRRALAWPVLAFVGVVLLTEPWQGTPDLLGIALAAIAAVGWGLYIVITQHVGDRFSGVDGLAISLPVAALVAAVVGVPQSWGNLTVQVLLVAAGAAILLPLIPWTFELYALRRLTKSAFGTLMALEPAIAIVIGAIVLSQAPTALQLVGIACVVGAGVAAERTGHREIELPDLETPTT
ncbi:MAG: EamA family transporter [Actinomycetales bacterium]|nr:EamA family transporter [Actinomycetales bacterium]